MSVSVFKTFAAGEVLTASDLNSSLTQITGNGEDLGWPSTKAKDMNGTELIMDADADSSITADSDDIMHFRLQGQDLFILNGATASSVNGLQMTASAASGDVILITQGSDTNIDCDLQTAGSGKWLYDGTELATNPLTTRGDVLYRNATVPARLAIGAANTVFQTDGTDPSWATVATAMIADNAVDETKIKDAFVADFTEVVAATGDSILLGDVGDSGNTKRDTIQGVIDLVPAASDTTAGVIERAVQSEMETGTSTSLAVTPGRQHFHPGHPKIWFDLDGTGTAAIDASYNGGGGLADNTTGDYTVTFDITLSSASFAAVLGHDGQLGGTENGGGFGGRTTTTVDVEGFDVNGASVDQDPMMVAIFGDI